MRAPEVLSATTKYIIGGFCEDPNTDLPGKIHRRYKMAIVRGDSVGRSEMGRCNPQR
jgi:hypothetical protein